MPLAPERTSPIIGAGKVAEPGESSAQFFGRRRPLANTWQPQNRWLGLMLLPPLSEAEEEPGVSTETVMASSEVSLEKASLSSGPTVITISDEQARQIMDSSEEDAFPQQ
jgi:hypothetical protein